MTDENKKQSSDYKRFTENVDSGFVSELDCRIAYNKLCGIENKIEQGYIKILPVKAGDKIYVVPSKASYGINRMHKTFRENNRVYTQTVDEIRFFKDGVYMVYSCEYQQNHHSEFFGETWFLEYEQAANRLKEMEAIYAKYDHKGGRQ